MPHDAACVARANVTCAHIADDLVVRCHWHRVFCGVPFEINVKAQSAFVLMVNCVDLQQKATMYSIDTSLQVASVNKAIVDWCKAI